MKLKRKKLLKTMNIGKIKYPPKVKMFSIFIGSEHLNNTLVGQESSKICLKSAYN